MFGGGAVPRKVDDPPIRAASIRGHLRFWWRATAGAGYGSEELFQEESKIWGNTENPGAVSVRVEVISAGTTALLRAYLPERVSPRTGPEAGYFVFPFNSDKENPIADGRKEITFKIRIVLSTEQDKEDEIRHAIQAWLLFGGVGTRTRRGCGALRCREKGWLPESSSHTEFIRQLVGATTTSSKHPTLSGSWVLFGRAARDSESCWRGLGRFWAQFRKGHFAAEYPHHNRNSMSGGKWGDHSTLTARRWEDHEVALNKPYLGLPIIYQDFPGDPKFRGKFHGEISNGVTGRMASPIIMKPVAFADGTVRPMIACLSAPEPESIKIRSQIVGLKVPSDDPVLKALQVSHPLEAVREAARRAGYEEVML